MHRFIIFLALFSIVDSKVFKCRTTNRDQNQPSCNVEEFEPTMNNMCLDSDVRGDNSGFFSVTSEAKQFCVTALYSYEDKQSDPPSKQVSLFRGVQESSISGLLDSCEKLCARARAAASSEKSNIIYFACYQGEDENDEDLTDVVKDMNSNYKCTNDDNYAKKNDRPKQPTRPAQADSSNEQTQTQPPDWLVPVLIVEAVVAIIALMLAVAGTVLFFSSKK